MPPKKHPLFDDIRSIVLAQSRADDEITVPEKCELDLRKWRLIQKHFHGHPFPTPSRIKRSEQWRDAVQYVRDVGEPEVLDWVLLQAEVAHNIERGVREMRPRKNGPCHELLMEYLNNRKRKAMAVYKWATTKGDKNTATNDTLTPGILDRHSTRGTGGTENL